LPFKGIRLTVINSRPVLTIELKGDGVAPGLVRSHELAEILATIEEGLNDIARRAHPEVKTAVVGLAGISESSLALHFSSPTYEAVGIAVDLFVAALADDELVGLPRSALGSVSKLVAFSKRHTRARVIVRSERTPGAFAIVHPETRVPDPRVISGSTTIHGRVVRVGGRDPKARLEIAATESVTCKVTKAIAKELGHQLYESVSLSGFATWDPDSLTLLTFSAETVSQSHSRPPVDALREISRLVGKHLKERDDENG
jgi:hypothetical protein